MSYLSQDQRVHLSNEEMLNRISFEKEFEKEQKNLNVQIEEQAQGLKITEEKFYSLKMFKKKW